MSLITIQNVKILNNPSLFSSPLEFEITFECHAPGLNDDLDWKLIYVTNAYAEEEDLVLEEIAVGPVEIGKNKFIFSSPAPDPSKISPSDLLDLTVIMLSACYHNEEFLRIGYYLNNDYLPESPLKIQLMEAKALEMQRLLRKKAAAEEGRTFTEEKVPLPPIDITQLWRTIDSEHPRITRTAIRWDTPSSSSSASLCSSSSSSSSSSVPSNGTPQVENANASSSLTSSSSSPAPAHFSAPAYLDMNPMEKLSSSRDYQMTAEEEKIAQELAMNESEGEDEEEEEEEEEEEGEEEEQEAEEEKAAVVDATQVSPPKGENLSSATKNSISSSAPSSAMKSKAIDAAEEKKDVAEEDETSLTEDVMDEGLEGEEEEEEDEEEEDDEDENADMEEDIPMSDSEEEFKRKQKSIVHTSISSMKERQHSIGKNSSSSSSLSS